MTKLNLRDAWALTPINFSFDAIENDINDQWNQTKILFDLICEFRHKIKDQTEINFSQLSELHKSVNSSSTLWYEYVPDVNLFRPACIPTGLLYVNDSETVSHLEKHNTPFCSTAFVLDHNHNLKVYIWINHQEDPRSLIDIDIDLMIGFSASYDASYLRPFYNVYGNARFIDVLSLANTQYKFSKDQTAAVRNMTRYGAKLPWMELGYFDYGEESSDDEDVKTSKKTSDYISLAGLYKFLYNKEHSKDVRDQIIASSWEDAFNNISTFCAYNYSDVDVTLKCFYLLYKRCLKTIPNAISWIGMIEESKVIYRIEDDFNLWLELCDEKYSKIKTQFVAKVRSLALSYSRSAPFDLDYFDGLDWEVKPRKLQQFEKFFGPYDTEKEFIKYRSVYKSGDYKYCEKWVKMANESKSIIPYLMQSYLLGDPVILRFTLLTCIVKYNWLVIFLKNLSTEDGITSIPVFIVAKTMFQGDRIEVDKVDVNGRDYNRICVKGAPLPNPKTNEEKGAITLFGSSYDFWYKLGVLKSPSRDLEYLNELYKSLNHWGRFRKRVHGLAIQTIDGKKWLKPLVYIAGALSGRTTSNLWNLLPKLAKDSSKLIGVEVMSKIIAPENMVIVHADIDSEELRGQAIISDMRTGGIESNPFSISVYTGDKKTGTDTHTLMGKQLGIHRNNAKNYVYGSAYLAGYDKLSTLCYPHLDLADYIGKDLNDVLDSVKKQARQFLLTYRGKSVGSTYVNGLASDYFNETVRLANTHDPSSLFLNFKHPKHLDERYCGSEFLTTRVNLNVQRMGTDIMHLYISAVQVISKAFGVPMHLAITIHDHFAFYVYEKHKEVAKDIMNTAHLFAWLYGIKNIGFKQISKEILFFESIDVDVRFRKNPSEKCVTMSNYKGFSLYEG